MATDQDQFDALDDESLLRYLEEAATKRQEHLAIGEFRGEWIAETWTDSGLAGRRAMFRADGVDRRTAMMGLARLLAGNR